MIKGNSAWKVGIASVVMLALWTLVCINTSLFVREGEFCTFEYIMCYVMTLGMWVIASLKFEFSKIFNIVLSSAIFLLTPFVCMQISMIFFEDIEYALDTYMLNVLIYFGVQLILFAIMQSTRWASSVTVICAYIFNIASHIVGIFRGTPLIPSDFLAIGTAIGVADQYVFKMDFHIIWAAVVAVFYAVLAFKFPLKLKFRFKHIVYPVSGLLAGVIVFSSLGAINAQEIDIDLFDQEKTNKIHGMTYGFYINLRRMALNKPENYSSDEMKSILESVPKSHKSDTPHVLVIMNESLSDLKEVGDFKTNIDYMPFMRSLKKNTIKGKLLVSPFGGYTCNSEFEMLTGASMGMLPGGSAPYLQYITDKMPYAVPAYMRELGYRTVAFHPYYARGWNREKVYGLLGFDEFVSEENMNKYIAEDDVEYIRSYISDNSSYDVVKNIFNSKKDGEKLFLFNITMQNHGGYTYGGMQNTVKLKGMNGYYPGAEQYLSLVKESDNAFKDLISYLQKWDEDIVILMFGDHLPAVEEEFYEEVKGKPLSEWTDTELVSRYTVPFMIWANYDIKERDDIFTSTNYLQNFLYEAASIPKNGLNVFMDELFATVPAINSQGHYNENWEWKKNENFEGDLKTYEALEYYMLTGKK